VQASIKTKTIVLKHGAGKILIYNRPDIFRFHRFEQSSNNTQGNQHHPSAVAQFVRHLQHAEPVVSFLPRFRFYRIRVVNYNPVRRQQGAVKVICFPGQGNQYVGMFYQRKKYFATADQYFRLAETAARPGSVALALHRVQSLQDSGLGQDIPSLSEPLPARAA